MAGGVDVVARWCVRRHRARPQACGDCGAGFDGIACPACGLLAPVVRVAQMAVRVELANGTRRLVVVERGVGGRWFAVRTLPATDKTVTALRRQDETPPAVGCGWWAA
jgi:hypothetical protein